MIYLHAILNFQKLVKNKMFSEIKKCSEGVPNATDSYDFQMQTYSKFMMVLPTSWLDFKHAFQKLFFIRGSTTLQIPYLFQYDALPNLHF